MTITPATVRTPTGRGRIPLTPVGTAKGSAAAHHR